VNTLAPVKSESTASSAEATAEQHMAAWVVNGGYSSQGQLLQIHKCYSSNTLAFLAAWGVRIKY